MKRILAIILAALMCISLAACGSGEETAPEGGNATAGEENASADASGGSISDMVAGSEGETAADAEPEVEAEPEEEFPVIGTWKNAEHNAYIRIKDGGEILVEMVSEFTSTSTVNGVTTSSTSSSITTSTATWSVDGDNFMYNQKAPYAMVVEGGEYKLVGEKTTYIRVGDLDYVIGTDSAESEQPAAEAMPYTVGEPLVADGIDMVFTEKGIADDIRVTSKTSGIQITSGPSPEADKQFVYLKGTVKNTGTTAVWPAVGGKIIIDGYEYDVRVDVINEDGTPASTIDPLDSVIIMLYAHIPTELTSSFSEAEMTFGFNNNFENVDITNSDYLFVVEF